MRDHDSGNKKLPDYPALTDDPRTVCYSVRLLPRPENRYGWETTCEVVPYYAPRK